MEEASVAGESPDRSKQRESSEEPTSGSAGPVPEARKGAPSDPRLAVARESAPDTGARADTATQVLSVRDRSARPAEAEESEGSAEAERSEEVSDSAGTEAGAERGGGTETVGDDRLRAAVAAWVTSAGPRDGADATAEEDGGDTDGEDGTGNGRSDASDAGARNDAGGDGDGGTDGEAADDTDADADAGSDAGGEEAAARAQGASEAKAGAADKGGDDAEPTAPAATKPEATAKAEGGAKSESGAKSEEAQKSEGTAKAGEARKSGQSAKSGKAEEAGKSGQFGAAGKAEEAETRDGAARPEEAPKADGTAKAESGAKPEEAPKAGQFAGSGKAEEGATSEERGTPEKGRASDEGGAGAKSDAAEGESGDDSAGAGATDDAEDGDRPGTGTGGGAPKGGGPGARGGDTDDAEPRGKAVDQPTAVFRTMAPKPPVDQPTTMLKLGDAQKAAAEAERTSRFVALKPLDDPSTRKPPPAATTALPKVPAEATAAVPQVGPERTTQQPLPPKPPLDLLAELTNTPPPPETPLRTTVRRVKIWTPLLLLLVVVFAIAQAVRPLPTPTLELTAEETYSFDGDRVGLPWPNEGQGWMDGTGIGTMDSFGDQKPVAIGSVAKAMTAYVILKEHPLKSGEEGPDIEVDATAEEEGGFDQQGESTLNNVKEGDRISERQALSAIMIPSANNIARLLARWDSGTEAEFIKKMNDAAEELGMTDTTYTDASGLKETTVSTAEDQVKLGNELVKIPALVEISSMGEWVDPAGRKHYNYNTLVPYNGAIGIKTGSTTAAGGNLLFAARKEVGGETVTVVGAILGQHKAPIIDTVNAVSKTALLAAQEALASAKILKKGDVVGYVDDRLGGRTPVVATQDVTAVGWAGLKVKLSFEADVVPHTAKAGAKVGTLTVGDGSGGAVEVPVALKSDLAEPGFTDKLTRIG
ncbi:D-alanyl-D-alanine carboxypeptidase [Streptomyces cadmiisoli]|uniref:serine-type D-Ala-D-Ala carboxypeptidase n=1 Tax=Streptomyces cadmiisoli TaxID=2184053 RepID=A0A2Z4J1L2_9ACTN|nr:D-alanyl-D-alanine carboxypeptidase [Streptomyces cadmiisoli]AWW39062.1 D-alanyl-D-alanine carboxypeptidase [Streptomyces cadmiisoli]